MEGDQSDIFEINDFTVVTDLEAFVVSLEALIHDWKLSGQRKATQAISKKPLKTRSGCATFYGQEYRLTNFYLEESEHSGKAEEEAEEGARQSSSSAKWNHLTMAAKELMDTSFDFSSSNIACQFGVGEYLLLTTRDESTLNAEISNTLLSAVTMALQGTDCELPFFVQLDRPGRNLHSGVAQNRNVRTVFEAAHLRKPLPKHRYLAGLIDMFKEKVNCPVNLTTPISVSVEFEYVHSKQSPSPSEVGALDESHMDTDSSQLCLHELGFGADIDPFKELRLVVSWPPQPDELVNETEYYSDLDPHGSPRWFASIVFHSDSKLALFNTLDVLFDHIDNRFADCPVSSFIQPTSSDTDAAHALAKLADPHSSSKLSFVPTAAASRAHQEQAFADCLKYVVSDERSPSHDEKHSDSYEQLKTSCEKELRLVKSAPAGSVTERIAVCLANLSSNGSDGQTMMCRLWYNIVQEIRRRWENNEDLPSLSETEYPDLSSSFLHQKLQIIQCCIATRRRRHKLLDDNNGIGAVVEDDDEFHDALDSVEEDAPKQDDILREPAGRLELFGSEKLLKHPERPIYVPITQDRGPMTEDMVDERTQYLASLETPDARAEAQLDTLKSDMEAFKAANPGAVIEDFVRWHSPRDWVVEEGEEGHLSERMQISGNVWQTTWNAALPVPVMQQARLFNETKEAEKVLQWFENMPVKDLVRHILPMVFTAAARLLIENAIHCVSVVESPLLSLCKTLARCSKQGGIDEYFQLRFEVKKLEWTVARFNSVCALLDANKTDGAESENATNTERIHEFANQLLAASTGAVRIVDAPNGPLSMALRQVMNKPFDSKELQMPPPTNKRYVLRWEVPRPGRDSRTMPQRMYASVKPEEFRISGSFSSDITFL